ncbi:MAG: aspartate aminotransferase family protein [Verrucomicrobiota bacterium]|nr:aspartate aminotransferase family protein [Verrucomicrobiota bacterium]
MLPEIKTAIPGPASRQLAADLELFESPNVTFMNHDFPIFWERAEGTNIWDVDGNKFLDLTAAFGVAAFGHTPLCLQEVMVQQTKRLFHAMGDVHPTREKVELCKKLSGITFERWNKGTGRVILGNSGFEAIEAALKTAFLATGKKRIIAFEGSYHGLGYGALEVTSGQDFRGPFKGQLRECADFFPFPNDASDLPDLMKRIQGVLALGQTSAVILEPVQGRGGVRIPPPEFFEMLRSITSENNVLLIYDEIFTGFGRLGTLFGFESFGGPHIAPDLICLGKALTGGFPLSACVGSADLIERAWPKSTGEAIHTSTYLGNPLGCAMACWSIDQALERSQAPLENRGSTLSSELNKLSSDTIKVRTKGSLAGIEFLTKPGQPDPALCSHVVTQGLKKGLIWLGGGQHHNVLTLSPPLCISADEIHFAVTTLKSLVNE